MDDLSLAETTLALNYAIVGLAYHALRLFGKNSPALVAILFFSQGCHVELVLSANLTVVDKQLVDTLPFLTSAMAMGRNAPRAHSSQQNYAIVARRSFHTFPAIQSSLTVVKFAAASSSAATPAERPVIARKTAKQRNRALPPAKSLAERLNSLARTCALLLVMETHHAMKTDPAERKRLCSVLVEESRTRSSASPASQIPSPINRSSATMSARV